MKEKFWKFIRAWNNCYLMYRCIFALNLPFMIDIPIRILILREHVTTMNIISSAIGWFFTLTCWENMRWDLLIEECQTIWRDICEQIKRHK